jgi:hypothetical protein
MHMALPLVSIMDTVIGNTIRRLQEGHVLGQRIMAGGTRIGTLVAYQRMMGWAQAHGAKAIQLRHLLGAAEPDGAQQFDAMLVAMQIDPELAPHFGAIQPAAQAVRAALGPWCVANSYGVTPTTVDHRPLEAFALPIRTYVANRSAAAQAAAEAALAPETVPSAVISYPADGIEREFGVPPQTVQEAFTALFEAIEEPGVMDVDYPERQAA